MDVVLKTVKWIDDSEIQIKGDEADIKALLASEGIRVFRYPKGKSSRAGGSLYIRYESDQPFSTGAYDFPENPVLESLCIRLHQLGFVFWGNFKTEISPYDYMCDLQSRGLLKEDFRHIQAGEDNIQIARYGDA